jgi:hypothetical protein
VWTAGGAGPVGVWNITGLFEVIVFAGSFGATTVGGRGVIISGGVTPFGFDGVWIVSEGADCDMVSLLGGRGGTMSAMSAAPLESTGGPHTHLIFLC